MKGNKQPHNQSLYRDVLQPSLRYGFRAGEFGILALARSTAAYQRRKDDNATFSSTGRKKTVRIALSNLWRQFIFVGQRWCSGTELQSRRRLFHRQTAFWWQAPLRSFMQRLWELTTICKMTLDILNWLIEPNKHQSRVAHAPSAH